MDRLKTETSVVPSDNSGSDVVLIKLQTSLYRSYKNDFDLTRLFDEKIPIRQGFVNLTLKKAKKAKRPSLSLSSGFCCYDPGGQPSVSD